MRYIDADKFKSDIKDVAKITCGSFTEFEVLGILSGQPTADVVDVVRCNDCKYDHKCSHNIIRPSKGGGVIYCPLEYCSEGERKDG